MLLHLLCLIFMAACSGNADNAASGSDTKADSAAVASVVQAEDPETICLALVPTLDCLPFYFAHEHGLFIQKGLKISVKSYNSQMDCDTAITRSAATIGATDLVRTVYNSSQGRPMAAVMRTDGVQAVVSNVALRLRKVSQLKLRTLAASRFSATDYMAARVLEDGGVKPADALRPQVNDLHLRTSMLHEGQVDAAVLPEPFVALARAQGHRLLAAASDSSRLGCMAASPALSERQDFKEKLQLLAAAYNAAADTINARGKEICRSLLTMTYRLPEAAIDSLRLPRYAHASAPAEADVAKAVRFLEQQGVVRAGRKWTAIVSPVLADTVAAQ